MVRDWRAGNSSDRRGAVECWPPDGRTIVRGPAGNAALAGFAGPVGQLANQSLDSNGDDATGPSPPGTADRRRFLRQTRQRRANRHGPANANLERNHPPEEPAVGRSTTSRT